MFTVDFHAHGVLTFYASVPESGALAISEFAATFHAVGIPLSLASIGNWEAP
jgi:hypothetical protein